MKWLFRNSSAKIEQQAHTKVNLNAMPITVDFEPIEIFNLLVALNPKYVDPTFLSDQYTAKVNSLYFVQSDRRLYLIFADAYVFASSDGLATLEEVREINYYAENKRP